MPKKSQRALYRPKSKYKEAKKAREALVGGVPPQAPEKQDVVKPTDKIIDASETPASVDVTNEVQPFPPVTLVDHNYCKKPVFDHDYCKSADLTDVECDESDLVPICVDSVEPLELPAIEVEIEISASASNSTQSFSASHVVHDDVPSMFARAALNLQEGVLPELWIPVAVANGLHVMKVSDQQAPVTQRSIVINKSGALTYIVHGKELQADHEVYSEKTVDVSSIEAIVSSALKCVTWFRQFEICCGVSNSKFKPYWKSCKDSFIDTNVFKEMRYTETCRSQTCSLLVAQQRRMCRKCFSISKKFSKRRKVPDKTVDEKGKVKTPNKYIPWKYLITPEKRARQERSQKVIRNIKAQIARLKAKINSMIATEGITLEDEEEAEDFKSLVEEAQSKCPNPLQKIFLEQQLEALKLKDKRSMRWHPMIIRLALRIKMISSAAYSELLESGFVALPSNRTLFDYSHVLDVREGICKPILDDRAKKVNNVKHDYQHFFTLMFDEVYISQNLVQRKSTGEVIGYLKLSEVEQEILEFEQKVKAEAEETPVPKPSAPPVAKRILSYLVKGISSNINGVVASYPVSSLTKEDLMDYTWDVIEACESKDIRVVAAVCDGSAVNRAFIDMHPPVTELDSGLVFDTVNVYAPDRNIYFFSDLPHLAKTARNCLYNSGKKGCRKLFKNGEYLTGDPIVKLFHEKQDETVTKLHKLSASCVFLNSYSRMNVSFAMRVLSASVSNLLKAKKWPGTSELSIFGEM